MQRHCDNTEVNFLEKNNLVKVRQLPILGENLFSTTTVCWDCFYIFALHYRLYIIMSPTKVQTTWKYLLSKNLFHSLIFRYELSGPQIRIDFSVDL